MYIVRSYFVLCLFFFFKQKTAYEMRISDWSSDVCSSDLHQAAVEPAGQALLKVGDAAGCGVGAEHDLTAGLIQTIERVEKLFLRAVAAREVMDEIGRASCRERVCQYV